MSERERQREREIQRETERDRERQKETERESIPRTRGPAPVRVYSRKFSSSSVISD